MAVGVVLYAVVFVTGLTGGKQREAAGRVKDPQDEDPIRRLELKV
jgi:hypothetical protein